MTHRISVLPCLSLSRFGGTMNRVACPMLFAASLALAAVLPLPGQVPAEEHEKHHSGNNPGVAPLISPKPGIMHGMNGDQPKELYPSLMGLPDLAPERREELRKQAQGRMISGLSLMSEAMDRLAQATENDDYKAMQEATALMREGFARYESGLAAEHALAEGKSARQVAMQWFKRKMNLTDPPASQRSRGNLGLSWFHLFVMVILVGFAAAMIWMYFQKMRRAATLLANLTSTSGSQIARDTRDDLQSATATLAAGDTGARDLLAGTPAPITPKKWSGKLRVSRIFQETPDVKTFRLMNPLGGALPFSYLPGQFLTVTVLPDSKPVRRTYTIASSPTQHDYAEITVKHEQGGMVSDFLHVYVREGDLLDFSGPSGSFIFTGRECKCILLIGGGVGITPLMSVLRYLTDRCWPGDIFLIYGCKAPRDIIFREELQYLQRRHPSVRVVLTVSRPEGADWQGRTGRITKELISETVPDLASRYVHVCGPVPMMEAVKKMLAELGLPGERIKTEAFGPALGRPERVKLRAEPIMGVEVNLPKAALPTVTFSLSNKAAPLPPDRPILDVADEIGVEIDNSCRVGTCGTCRVKLLSGSVTMAVEDGLEPGDKEQGIILACQAKSTGNITVEA